MAFTKEEIREKAFQLEAKGASPDKIREFVSLASQDIVLGRPAPTYQETAPEYKSILERITPTKEELPEFILSSLGDFTKRTPLGLALAGGGAIVGEGIRQAVFEEKPLSIKERLLSLGKAGLRGIGGKLIGEGIGKLFTPFRGGVTPKIEIGRIAAESAGITPPLSTITESKPVQAMEKFVEVSPFGGTITRQKGKALKIFEDYAKTVGQEIAPNVNPNVVGNSVKESVKKFKEVFEAAKNELYDLVLPILKDEAVDTTPIISKLNEIIKRRAGIAEPSGLNKIREFIKELSSEKPNLATFTGGEEGKISSFQQLKNFRTNVGTMGKFDDPALSGLRSDFNELYGTITQVMDDTSSKVSPEIAAQFKKANEFFHQGKTTLKSGIYSALIKTNPENIHKVVIVPDGVFQYKISKEIIGEDTIKEVQRQWFDSVIENSSKIREGEIILNPLSLAGNLKKYSATIDEMFKDNPLLLKSFKDLENISQLMTRGKKITEGSQTAFLLKMLSPVMIGLQAVGAIGLTSKVGREYLTRGYPKLGKLGERIVRPMTQLGLQKYQE